VIASWGYVLPDGGRRAEQDPFRTRALVGDISHSEHVHQNSGAVFQGQGTDVNKRTRLGVVMYSLTAIFTAVLTVFNPLNGKSLMGLLAGLITVLLVVMAILTARQSRRGRNGVSLNGEK